MVDVKHHIRRPFSALHGAATKKVIRQFATKYHLVYFGRVDARSDEHALVRGMTASAHHTDNHYSVGTFNGHDITVVERRDTHTFPGKPDIRNTWVILQIDLKRAGLPHVIMLTRHHDETFFANLMLPGTLQNITSNVSHYDPVFASAYTILAPQPVVNQALHVVAGPLSNTVVAHFRQFDFEIQDDQVLIYANNVILTPVMLNHMLRAGLWAADQLNAVKLS